MRNSEFGIKDTAPNSEFRIPNYTQRRAVTFSASGASRKQWSGTRIGKTKTPKT
ncbi:MAG: hypothetical protein LBQ66_16310 [Planctomycetaceae bacterium]|nr:hypothetical protein [Planctomycetaceae bacterium]